MKIQNKYQVEVWIGLAKVKSIYPESIIDANSAYVNVLALARSRSDFRRKVNIAVANKELLLMRMEDIEPLISRIENFKVPKVILDLAKQLVDFPSMAAFAKFHTYD